MFLYEEERLGKLARYISQLPDKRRILDFVTYLEFRAKQQKSLYLFTRQEADIRQIKRLHPDVIINATGSGPLLPPIKSFQECLNDGSGRVGTIRDMIDGVVSERFSGDFAGKCVAVIGGEAVGIDVVEYFGPRHASCAVVKIMPEIDRDLDPVSKSTAKQLFGDFAVKQYTEI